MKKDITVNDLVVVGLDLGDKYSWYCRLGISGDIDGNGRVRSNPKEMRKFFEKIGTCRIVMEVGPMSRWVSALASDCGFEVIVANPRKVRAISESDSKTDRADAELLARLGRVDPKLLHPIRHRGPEAQADLAVLKARAELVRTRTALVNHVRGVSKSFGVRLPLCSTPSFEKKNQTLLPAVLRPAFEGILKVLQSLGTAISEYDEQIDQLSETKYKETALLRQVPGVGVQTSLTFVLTLEDPHRFKKSRQVGSFVGLRPKLKQSGARDPQMHITKAGDADLRCLLVQCAHRILGPFGHDSTFRRWGEKLSQHGGKATKKRAIVAVARKLAVLLHRLWITGEVYDPLKGISQPQVA